MKYSLYVTSGKTEVFLQTAHDIPSLEKNKGTYTRWMVEMGFDAAKFAAPILVIRENDVPIFEAIYHSPRCVWRSIAVKLPEKSKIVD